MVQFIHWAEHKGRLFYLDVAWAQQFCEGQTEWTPIGTFNWDKYRVSKNMSLMHTTDARS